LRSGTDRAVQVPPARVRDVRPAVHVQHQAEALRGPRAHREAARERAVSSVFELEPQTTAMLVVELQNDLVHESLAGGEGLSGKLAEAVREREVLPKLAGLLEECRSRGVPVLYATKERH